MTIIGIDPGISGAIAIVIDGELVDVYDMPTIEIQKTKGTRNEVNGVILAGLLKNYRTGSHAALEGVNAGGPNMQGRKQGITSAFNFGKSYGMIHGVLNALGIPTSIIYPQSWKRAYGLTSDKEESLLKAAAMFHSQSDLFSRKKDDGRAEAALLAMYLYNRSDKSTSAASV